ncbi:hypothetical protein GQ600_6541 [Phytophthora cactorum]|nr:hypothetical protein GQ600_6541 [Phytophthora cactorum]
MRLYYIVLFAAAALLTTSESSQARCQKKAQVQLWLTQRKPADAAFKLFKLENTKGRLFGTKEVLDWAKHVARSTKRTRGDNEVQFLKWMKASERPSVIEEKLKALGNLDLWSKQTKLLWAHTILHRGD